MSEEIENININQQIKSKERVAKHGEVFTSEREVNAMLDLVKDETEKIESRFLESACGTGNFLVEILNRKLKIVEQKYNEIQQNKLEENQLEYERNAVIAVSSIYGIDILQDNVNNCIERLYEIFKEKYQKKFKNTWKQNCIDSIKYILQKNIVFGNALDFKNPNTNEPIVFSEWTVAETDKNFIQRKNHVFEFLVEKTIQYGFDLDFSEEKDTKKSKTIDEILDKKPTQTHFLKLSKENA